jgi:hypothetical protein
MSKRAVRIFTYQVSATTKTTEMWPVIKKMQWCLPGSDGQDWVCLS